MLIASLFALALAADDGPLATSPGARPAPAVTAAQPSGNAANAPETRRDPDIPATAPTDDYGFVAWCHGALSGHMELHDQVKPEMDKVSPNGGDDAEQTKAGLDYLQLYARALSEAEKASPINAHARGVAANAQGYRIWAAARAAEPRTRMWSYLMWELPPRCEIAAKRLEERSTLMAEALRPNSGPLPEPATAAPEPAPSAEPPAPPAEAAPEPTPATPSGLPPIGGAGLRGPE